MWYKHPAVIGLGFVLIVAAVFVFWPYTIGTIIEDTFVGGVTKTVALTPVLVGSMSGVTERGDLSSILRADGKSSVYEDYYTTSRTNAGITYQYIYFDISNLPRFSASNIKKIQFHWTGCLSCQYLCYYAHQPLKNAVFKVELSGNSLTQTMYYGDGTSQKEYGDYNFVYDGVVLDSHLFKSGDKTYLRVRMYISATGDPITHCDGSYIYSEYVPPLEITYDLGSDAPYSQKKSTTNIKGPSTIGC